MKKPRTLILFVSLLFLSVTAAVFQVHPVYAAPGVGDFERILKATGGFTDEDIVALRKGEPISKLLGSTDDREVSVIGVTAFERGFETALKTLQDVIGRRNKDSLLQMGNFGAVPVFAEIDELTIEEADIRDLSNCRIGRCSIKLDSAMIERFQREIDWTSTENNSAASKLYREMIVQYLQRYLTDGNSALLEYRNENKPLKLREDVESMQNGLLLLSDFAPEFSAYLRDFPRNAPPNVKSSLTWSKIKFGLKPVVVVTQTINYEVRKDGVSLILSVSRQLYASRYFDSSVGLSAFFRFPGKAGQTTSFLVYQNRSRSSSLEGAFSSFKKEIVEREAISKLKPMLEDTRSRLDYVPRETSDSEASPSAGGRLLNWIFQYRFWLIGGFFLLVAVIWFAWRKPNRES